MLVEGLAGLGMGVSVVFAERDITEVGGMYTVADVKVEGHVFAA
jgi:hypothetical protein